jgi:dATP pyrophosphohydrolase
VVYTDAGEVLLLKRRRPFEFWQSITGSLEPDETPFDTARRELREETGLSNQGELRDSGISRTFSIDPRWRNRYAPGVSENTEHEWHYRLDAAIDIEISGAEHAEYCWLDVDAAIETVWSWTNQEALRNLKAQLQ